MTHRACFRLRMAHSADITVLVRKKRTQRKPSAAKGNQSPADQSASPKDQSASPADPSALPVDQLALPVDQPAAATVSRWWIPVVLVAVAGSVLVVHWPVLKSQALCFDHHMYLDREPVGSKPQLEQCRPVFWGSARAFDGGGLLPATLDDLADDRLRARRPARPLAAVSSHQSHFARAQHAAAGLAALPAVLER